MSIYIGLMSGTSLDGISAAVVRSFAVVSSLAFSARALATAASLPTLGSASSGPKFQPRPHSPPVIKVLEAGSAPLAPLRYALKGSQDVTVVARGQMVVSKDGETQTIGFPALTTTARLTPQKDGVGYVWTKGTFVAAPNQPPDTTTGHMMIALEGSTGLLQSDARGVISNILLRARPGDSGKDGMLEKRSIYAMEMGKAILSLNEVPFPEEPMGVGGRWRVERIAVRGMISIRQFTTFTILKREGNLLQLSYRLGGDFDEGSGFQPHELKLEVSGGGKCTVNFTLPMPVPSSRPRISACLIDSE